MRRAGVTLVLASLAGQAILVVSGVLVARLLPVDERGQLALIALLPLILAQLGGLGVPLAVTYELAREPRSARAVASLLVGVVPVQALCLVLMHFGILIAVFHDEDRSVWTAALLSLAAVPALLCQQVGLGILQGRQRFSAFNVQRLVPMAAYAAVLVVLALGGVGTLVTCAVAWSGAWLLAGIVTITTALRGLRATRGDAVVDRRSFFHFGRRGLLGSVFLVESFQLDQLIVGLLLSPAALGLYVVAVALTNLPRFVAQSIGILAYPRIAAQSDRRIGARLLWRYFWICAALNVLIVGFLELTVGDIIPFLFGKDYAEAVGIAQVLLLGSFLQSARRVLADGARGLGHPELSSVAEVASWFVLVPALIVLAPSGAQGVAVAIVLMSGASLVILVVSVIHRGRQRPDRSSATDAVIPPETVASAPGNTG